MFLFTSDIVRSLQFALSTDSRESVALSLWNMASNEHIKLSDFIKSVHINLRKRTLEVGPEEAWKKHCKEKDVLNKYATAMKELATQHWEENYKQGKKAISRIEWTNIICRNYFLENDKSLIKYRERELEIANKMGLELNHEPNEELNNKVLKLLDVGSCYNPFKSFNYYDVLAIDLIPACDTVMQCDFLKVCISNETKIDTSSSSIISIKQAYFDVVVFSLLLEYLPSAEQRLNCCQNAYKLLKNEGILIVITPDSKHVGANAKIMKTWRFLLAKIGFSRIKYEKLPYMHCMVFRKSLKLEIAKRWADIYEKGDFYSEMVIPQDFNNKNVEPS